MWMNGRMWRSTSRSDRAVAFVIPSETGRTAKMNDIKEMYDGYNADNKSC